MNELVFTCWAGEPKPKQGAQIGVNRKTGQRFMYNTDEINSFQDRMKVEIARQLPRSHQLIDGVPVFVAVTVVYPIPKSWPKWRKLETFGQFKLTKPDSDNVAKAICDPFNGLVWRDDELVQLERCHRFWADSENMTEVRTEVLIRWR